MPKIQLKFIRALLKRQIKTPKQVAKLKREFAKKYKIPIVSNSWLLKAYHNFLKSKSIRQSFLIEQVLRKKPIRSLSGIVNVSVLTKPYKCPGKCIYCPSEKNIPQSYLAKEPAVQRAIKCNFHPYQQVQSRLKALQANSHPTDKIELRVVGGTWSYYPQKYREWFIKELFRACNEQISASEISKPILQKKSSLKKEQSKNETAKNRIIGLSIETRPDFINQKEIKNLRRLGVTRVELGAQSLYNDVLKIIKRGHNVQATICATKLLKDTGFKISYQMMLNLPRSNPKRDFQMFKKLFKNPSFCPDSIKIYPLALIKSSPIYKLYQQSKFQPYNLEELKNLIIKIKQIIPSWVRTERIIRDIPKEYIVAGGAKTTNLRQIIQQEMQVKKLKCHCIRCYEVKTKYNIEEKIYLFRKDYKASKGKEIFLIFANKKRDKLFSLLRLRILSDHSSMFHVLQNSAIIRELHTYGQMAVIDELSSVLNSTAQHRGLGKRLVRKAEAITKKEFKLKKIAVISGIGARGYYRKLDYKLEDSYMVKEI